MTTNLPPYFNKYLLVPICHQPTQDAIKEKKTWVRPPQQPHLLPHTAKTSHRFRV